MKFTLINRAGRVRTFFIREVAELYQSIEGGVLFTSSILDVVETEEICERHNAALISNTALSGHPVKDQ